ncbi:DNA-binding MurR/RpiR family transcriptional regulator [Bacillus mesophilus]|uniref:MurR/RpiR family transcriptional regulator n=1 Tax=Bacillus mesophilus TaxID=1808955 RepID=A0A6M0Q7T7_9BACI|nr:MurR/RpiR family transcriptional regulator [Bacillus mesophilus]MBM7661764.1 DNA-binding MurR/RpiR family transcriptional regulator [Bacillus mesophilus]NEY72422.1 MurR/RpiR family transcriptional regulator [Bacillus mesophilus]
MTNTTQQNRSKLGGLIKSYYPSLTKSEQKVADIVIEQMEKVIYYSVTDLADVANVGETTVLRFCRKIGLKGYQEFKLAIAKDLSTLQEQNIKEEESDSLTISIANYTKMAIDETVNMIDDNNVQKAIDMIKNAKGVHFFGVGTSGLTALDAKHRFIRIGKRTDALIDPHIQSMTAATFDETDVVVGLSVSGSTKDTIDSLQVAKENGAKVIAITYYARSPITKIADCVLLSGGKESPLEGGSLAAKISQLFVIDLLCTGIALEDKKKSVMMKERTARAVLNKLV